ncbi:hypothetical protein GmHk_06G017355 [Glycine max]|nr:hypothetical protein GmHk_06G017355 [Glycine max]
MEENHPQRMTLEDYSSPIIPQYFTSIARPEVQAANFSYPYCLIQLIQGNLFHGLPSEDPYAHLATYIDICNTVKIVRVPENATRLNLFPFSLAGEAKRWLHSFKGNNLRTWEEVVEKFLKKYFPESKTVEGKMEISSFHQFLGESLNEALDRFCGLLWKTPTHGYSEPETRSHQKSTGAAIRNLEIQVGQLAHERVERPTRTSRANTEKNPKEECKAVLTRSQKRTQEEGEVEEDQSEEGRTYIEEEKEKKEEEGEKKEEIERNKEKAQQWEKHSQVEIQQESILQVNTPPHQLIIKEERHQEHNKPLSVLLSLTTSTSLATIWKVFPAYMSFMASLAKRRKCKEDVFFVTFMPP